MSVTLKIINNFNSSVANGTDYFDKHYGDDEVWLFFLKTSGKITYTDASKNVTKTVTDASSIQLSTVKDGTFTLATVEKSAKLFAGLGTTSPFSGTDGPSAYQADAPYALAEWTIQGNVNDNIDISYIDSFSFPTVATITNSSGTQTGKSGFLAGTKASDVITAFKTLIDTKPVGPNNSQKPTSGQDGYGPEVPTVSGNSSAVRWVGSSKYYITAPNSNNNRSMYTYAPSFHGYLKYLQENQPTSQTNDGLIEGWFIDYSGNNGYSGFLKITGSDEDGYGLEVHTIRVNTKPSAANNWKADPNAGTKTSGKITVVANNTTLDYVFEPVPTVNHVTGMWTDAVIYSGAGLLSPPGEGPVITGTGDFAPGGTQNVIVATFIASVSASITTGLLGSQMYQDGYAETPNPKGTMYWFQTLSREESMQKLFGNAWSGNVGVFYDPFWAVLAGVTNNQGYLSPFNDRWSNFSPDLGLTAGDTIQWELGLTKKSS